MLSFMKHIKQAARSGGASASTRGGSNGSGQDVANTMPAHSRIGPSSIYRRIACPGSLHQEEIFEATHDIKESEHATEGTHAHEVLEVYLTLGTNPAKERLAELFKNCTTKEQKQHWNYISDSAETVLSYVDKGYDLFCEVRLEELRVLHPECFGTSDIILYHPEKNSLISIDFKYGKGVYVDATNEYEDMDGVLTANTQILTYAYGAMLFINNKFGKLPDKIEIGVLQPRIEYADDTLRLMKLSPLDVEMQIDALKSGLKFCFTKEARTKLSIGEHCKFCNARPVCPKQIENTTQTMNEALEMFNVEDLSGATHELKTAKKQIGGSKDEGVTPTPEQLHKLWTKLKDVETFYKALSSYMYARAESGEGAKYNVKLVPGRSKRAYAKHIEGTEDLMLAFSTYGVNVSNEDCSEEKIKPFTRLQKDLEHEYPDKKAEIKKVLDEILVKQEGKPTLVDSSDKRDESSKSITDKELFAAFNGLGQTE